MKRAIDIGFLKRDFSFYYVILTFIFCIGFFLRFKTYFSGYTLWLDECSLSLSVIKRGIFGYFSPLEHTQSAPPLFMMFTKFLTNIFGINEFSLRFIPFASSIVSIPLFYFVSRKFLFKKYVRILALLLFCINYPLIYYSAEFKQYSSDVLICLLFVLIFLSFNIKTSELKKIFILGTVSFFGTLFSLPVFFTVGAFVLCCFWSLRKELKSALFKISVFLSPFIFLMPFYYLFVLYPSKLEMTAHYRNLWQGGFLTLNPLSAVLILKENLSYFFSQNSFILFGVLLLIAGFICIVKNIGSKDENISNSALFLTSFFLCVILASFFEIYPLKERVALYLLPYLIILIVKPLDMCFCVKEISVYLIFFFFISSYNFQYFSNLYKNIEFKKGAGEKFMQILENGYKEGDIVVYNDASAPLYEYNSMRRSFKTNRFVMIKNVKYEKEYYKMLLNSLPKGQNYWFYYPYDYYERPVIPFLKEWANGKNILKEHNFGPYCLLNVTLQPD